jgi:hydroxylamine reductase
VLDRLNEIVTAIEDGHVEQFFIIAGCDAPTPGREYYRELAESVPEECVIMTTACGKFRFNDLDFGTVLGTEIPRYIDFGQRNNSISTVAVTSALADELDCGINDLPLSVVLSWFEQKAVAVLLGLLHLGVEDIYLGPTLPEFLTPGLVEHLNDAFGLRPTDEPESDLDRMLASA